MEVTILGTGSIYAKSNCASLLIDEHILVDVGPGIIKYLIKNNYDLLKIDNIILTHLHTDHILDFPTFIVNIDELGAKRVINIYAPRDTKIKLLELLHILYGDWFDEYIENYCKFIDIDDDYVFNIKGNEFKTKEVKHPGIKSYGFIVDNGFSISGDTSLCEGVRDIIKDAKVIVTDCSFIKGNDYHMGIDDIQKLICDYPDKTFILTHFRDETKNKLKDMNLKNILVVDDGYSFKVEE